MRRSRHVAFLSTVLISLLFFLGIAAAASNATAATTKVAKLKALKFALFADAGIVGTKGLTSTADLVTSLAGGEGRGAPQLLVNVGDLVWAADNRTSLADVEHVATTLTNASGGVPLISALGDRDIAGASYSRDAFISTVDSMVGPSLQLNRTVSATPYFSFAVTPAYRFIVLDSSMPSFEATQIQWLEATLEMASKLGQRCIVVSHRPLYPYGSTLNAGKTTSVVKLLAKYWSRIVVVLSSFAESPHRLHTMRWSTVSSKTGDPPVTNCLRFVNLKALTDAPIDSNSSALHDTVNASWAALKVGRRAFRIWGIAATNLTVARRCPAPRKQSTSRGILSEGGTPAAVDGSSNTTAPATSVSEAPPASTAPLTSASSNNASNTSHSTTATSASQAHSETVKPDAPKKAAGSEDDAPPKKAETVKPDAPKKAAGSEDDAPPKKAETVKPDAPKKAAGSEDDAPPKKAEAVKPDSVQKATKVVTPPPSVQPAVAPPPVAGVDDDPWTTVNVINMLVAVTIVVPMLAALARCGAAAGITAERSKSCIAHWKYGAAIGVCIDIVAVTIGCASIVFVYALWSVQWLISKCRGTGHVAPDIIPTEIVSSSSAAVESVPLVSTTDVRPKRTLPLKKAEPATAVKKGLGGIALRGAKADTTAPTSRPNTTESGSSPDSSAGSNHTSSLRDADPKPQTMKKPAADGWDSDW